MKQLLLSLTLSIGCGLLLLSCSRDEPAPDEATCNRVVQVFEALPDGSTSAAPFSTIDYDDSGRVRTVTGPGTERRSYAYYPDSVAVKTVYSTGAVDADSYWLDDKGRVVRSADYRFQYDADGYLSAFQYHNSKHDPGSDYISYTVRFEGGNMAEVYSSDPSAPLQRVALNYHPQPHQDVVGFNSPLWEGRVLTDWSMVYLVPGGYFGKPSKDLVVSAPYRFDDKGRIVTMDGRWAFRYRCP